MGQYLLNVLEIILKMNGKERVLTALNHQEPDPVPLDLGGRQMTLMIPAYERLKEKLGFPDTPKNHVSHLADGLY